MRRTLALLALVLVAAGGTAAALDDPGRADQWALDRIGATSAPAGGDGIVVAIIDSGIDLDHVELRDRVVPGIDLVDDDAVPADANGHGTHVAGIVGAAAGNGAGVAGVAPAAQLMPVRVLDASGSGTADDVVAGIRWAVAHGADVINLSLGEQTQALLGPTFGTALDEAWEAGVVAVVAAGNERLLGSSGFTDQPAIVVAATTRADTKPSYSSVVGDAKWGMAAPGGDDPASGADGAVLSTFWFDGKRDQYAYEAGTSQAAPHVTGAVAVLLGLGLSPAEAVDRVLHTAVDIGAPGRDPTFGWGRLDIAAATDGIDERDEQPAPSPAPAPSPTTTPPPASAPATSTTVAPAAPGATTSTTVEPAPVSDLGTETESARAGNGGTDTDRTATATVAAILAGGAAAAAAVARRRLPR